MTITVVAYILYLAIAIGMTIWVAWTLSTNGKIYLVRCFGHDEELATSVNHLLVVGFYLVNLGFIALALRNDPASPWHKQLSLGGNSTSGMTRKASLRTFQKAVQRFLKTTAILKTKPAAVVARVVLEFWQAVAITLAEAWSEPRRHQLTKGVGVYALMDIAADLYLEAEKTQRACDKAYFVAALADFAPDFDWSNTGPLKGLGGEAGAKAAAVQIRAARRSSRLKLVSNG